MYDDMKRCAAYILSLLVLFISGSTALAEDSGIVWIVDDQTGVNESVFPTQNDSTMNEFDAWIDNNPTQSTVFSDDATSDTGLIWGFPIQPSVLINDTSRLVNANNLLESDFIPEHLVKIIVRKTSSASILMCQEAADALERMFNDAAVAGITLYAHSGYRSYQNQKTLYSRRLERNHGVDDGYVAMPGASDHQTGLGIDVISKAWIGRSFNSAFASTAEARWMAEYCADYGFIIRYPEGKESVTHIEYEPWHLRYVGEICAQYIMSTGLTLEEFDAEWRPLYVSFVADGGTASASSIHRQTPGGTSYYEFKPLSTGVYQTTIKGADGDYEYSLFEQKSGDI
jgi:D-alanyl-D-alanine carboxypeptidase